MRSPICDSFGIWLSDVPKVSVLYISESVTKAHFELLRNICDPQSKSKPHVTVRYFDKLDIPTGHLDQIVTYIDVLAPGSFGLEPDAVQPNRTVYLRCQSDELLGLEHKPLFPTSEFHVTVYDGEDREFAVRLQSLLRKYAWGFRVRLPSKTTLSAIEIKRKGSAKRLGESRARHRSYSPDVAQLFEHLFKHPLESSFVSNLSDGMRLRLVRKVCDSLHVATSRFPRAKKAHVEEPVTLLSREHGAPQARPEVHLTPPELAHQIALTAISYLDERAVIHFGDPAVGVGAFYSALLRVVDRKRIASAIGIDINPEQVVASQWRWGSRGMKVLQADYLHLETLASRNLILANPPYLRQQDIPVDYKIELQNRASAAIGERVSGLSSQYVYFLILSHRWLLPDAICAWLIPAEFMRTQYGEVIRKYFTKHVQLLRVHQLDEEQTYFENAIVLPAIVFFRNRIPRSNDSVELSRGGSLVSPAWTESVPLRRLREDHVWTIPSQNLEHVGEGPTLGDYFRVQRGIATGANGFFIMTREEARARGLPKLALRPVLPKIKSIEGYVVEADEDGYPSGDVQHCVIDTTLDEREILGKFPRLHEYLQKGVNEGVLERTLVASRKPWYKQESREQPLFVCSYMGRGNKDHAPIRFLLNKSRAIGTNTYLHMYPSPALKSVILRTPSRAFELLALLNDIAASSLQNYTRLHAGGLQKIEPRELMRVPLVGAPAWLKELATPSLLA
jgi:adenine-specific DNA-methyltransferase